MLQKELGYSRTTTGSGDCVLNGHGRTVEARDGLTEPLDGMAVDARDWRRTESRTVVSRYATRPVNAWDARNTSRDVDVWDEVLEERAIALDHDGRVDEVVARAGRPEAALIDASALVRSSGSAEAALVGSPAVVAAVVFGSAVGLINVTQCTSYVQLEIDGAGADVMPQR